MKDRIQQYMDYKSISAGELASVLDVQRSNISHILNGRNKPGAAFIEKFLISFPDLNARWLLTGQGDMLLDEMKQTISEAKPDKVNRVEEPSKTIEKSVKNDKPISKIILFYNDGTFEDYNKR